MSTESFSSERFTNIRRQVFYQYPNGKAPLTGLLSLLKDEPTNDPEFSIYEKRMQEQRTTTASQGSSKGPFLDSGGTDLGDDQTITQDTEYRVKVESSDRFRVAHVIKIMVANGGSTDVEVKGVVTSIVSTTVIKFRALNTTATVANGATNENVGKEVLVVGSAYSQGSTDVSREIYDLPVNVGNYTQIFRTPFSLTGTAAKTEAKYDDSGPYKDKAKEHSILHMIELEKAFLFGKKHKYVGADGLPVYTTNGLLEWLALWEAGSTYGNTAATANTDDNKRIIKINGNITIKDYNKYLERLFRVTNNVANEKLVLCGSGFLSVMNEMYEGRTCLTSMQGKEAPYGMTVVQHVTPWGTIYYKTHPLMSQNATMRYNALYVDVQNLKYRYIAGRDTELLKNRQANDADYRKDEWLTECGLEVLFPESHMYIEGVTGYTP
jgi:hypothetical protein